MPINNNPFTISTNNVPLAINQASARFRVSKDLIYFTITSVTTSIRNIKKRASGNVKYIDEELLIDSNLMISQKYELLMHKKDNKKSVFPNVVFANNSSRTTAYLIIKRKQDLNLSAFSRSDFLSHLEAIAIKYDCFIRITKDDPIKMAIEEIYANYEVGKIVEEDIKIKIIDFPDTVKPVIDSLELVYEKKNKESQDKEKLASVKKGFTVIKYNKIKKGILGRTYSGKFINVSNIKPSHTPKFSIDLKTIDKQEDDNCINYVAKETGFVFFQKKILRIDNETEMFTADIRNKDKLVTSLDDGVSLNVKSKDKLSDAVAGNIHIKSDKVNINGNVGPSATVEGNTVKIGGQTHSKSSIKGKKVYIAKHKGEVQGQDILVNILEGGTIIGHNVRVKVARGGRIEGENVIVGTIESNVEVIASKKIKVDNITGESNYFTLKPLMNSFSDDKENVSLEGLIHKQDVLEDGIKKEEKKLKEKLFLIEFNKESLDIQRDDKIDKVRYNINSSQTMDNKLKSYVKLQDEAKELEKNISKYKKNLDNLDKKIEDIYSDTENAFMDFNKPWSAGNSIHLHHDGKVYDFYPSEDMVKSPISYDTLKKQNLI